MNIMYTYVITKAHDDSISEYPPGGIPYVWVDHALSARSS